MRLNYGLVEWGFAAVVVSDIVFVGIVVGFVLLQGFPVMKNFGPAIWAISAVVTTTLLFVLIGIAVSIWTEQVGHIEVLRLAMLRPLMLERGESPVGDDKQLQHRPTGSRTDSTKPVAEHVAVAVVVDASGGEAGSNEYLEALEKYITVGCRAALAARCCAVEHVVGGRARRSLTRRQRYSACQ